MIRMDIKDARIEKGGPFWMVLHPSNNSILAHCDTRKEAEYVRGEIQDLAKKLGVKA
jgi:hypothetical protein